MLLLYANYPAAVNPTASFALTLKVALRAPRKPKHYTEDSRVEQGACVGAAATDGGGGGGGGGRAKTGTQGCGTEGNGEGTAEEVGTEDSGVLSGQASGRTEVD